jgi:glyoxylase-like metal-dependent hydrolase (beta-lactamase superfamily II)
MDDLLHQTDRMLLANGVPHDEMVSLRDATKGLEKFISPAFPDKMLREGDNVITGEFTFRVVWTPGHSSGHICLYEPERKVLISGDHILPRITPNISVHPQSIEDPLGRYINALKQVRELDVELTLPGHDEPFAGVRERIDAIIHHHVQRNMEILTVLQQDTHNTYEIARELIWGTGSRWHNLPDFHKRMAVFETLAHLTMLAGEGYLDVLPRKGVTYYRQR